MTKFSWKPLLVLMVPVVVACETTSQTPAPTPKPVITPTPTPAPKPSIGFFKSSGHAGLDIWRIDFANRAVDRGFKVATVRSVLDGIQPMLIFRE